MLIRILTLTCAFCLAATLPRATPAAPPAPQTQPGALATSREEALAKQVEVLQAKVKGLEQKVAELQEKLEESRRDAPNAGGLDLPEHASGPNRVALAKITLPDKPTREQVTAYVNQVLQASNEQRMLSTTDPQVAMLAKVGSEHLDVLLQVEPGSGDLYVNGAVERIATDAQKADVIAALPHHKQLVSVVIHRGWQRDAKATLIAGLKSGERYLPTEWVQAVADLQDPETFPALRRYLISGANAWWTYNAVAGLPGIDLDEWVDKAWAARRTEHGPYSDGETFAAAAAAHGHADALGRLFAKLSTTVNQDKWQHDEARRNVLALVDATGTDAELVQWYRQNRDRLSWDHNLRKYVTSPASQPAKP
jgi:hypothetical protein